MQLPNTKDVLQKLIELTSERDTATLETSLAQTLFDLVAIGSVVIYRVLDIDQAQFTTSLLEVNQASDEISPALSQALIQCVQTSENQIFCGDSTLKLMLYPLRGIKNQTVAVIAVESHQHASDLHEVTEMLLQVYQNFIALIIDNERDTLTGLLNRKTFEHKINKVFSELLSQHARKGDKVGQTSYLAIFDIDHFKRVNDEFGHLMGDEVLLLFSQIMNKTFRDKDMLFRFGGEEFVGVFECTNVDDIERALHRFREKVGEFTFPQVGKITVSAGYTQVNPYDNSAHLIDRADAALYYAKNHGRNCVHSYDKLVLDGHLQENKIDSDIELF